MDRKIKKKKWTLKRIGLIAGITLVIGLVGYQLLFADNRSKLNVERDKITVSTIREGEFQEFIPVTGNILPAQTIYLDAIEGGIIQEIILESGALVEKGDVIMKLANSDLQLEVLNREAQLYEQINLLRNTRLQLEQNTLSLEQQLAEIGYQINLLKPQYQRNKQLYEDSLISRQAYEQVMEEYKYQRRRRELTYTRYRQDSISAIIQLDQLADSEARMIRSLEVVSRILDNLVIRAPISGQLSTSDLQVGQSINIGERLGQVDVLNEFKVRVRIDELYLPRIDRGQTGSFDFAGDEYELVISKIYPTIAEGRFEVDMDFVGEAPSGIKRGQTLRIRLELGNSAQAVLLPIGGFYKDTGGNWVYLVEEGGEKAVKKEIRLGRKNPDFFEVMSGLEPGDKVITSSYDYFGDNEVLILK